MRLGDFQHRLYSNGILQVIKLLVKNSVHRVYVAGQEGHGKPEHTVTPADIMLALCKHTSDL